MTILVATAMIEISFSAMKYIKNELHNWMGDQWMNDCLVVYIERDVAWALIMKLLCNDFKIWKLVEGNCKFYVFTCFFIVVVVNIWISLFIRLCNLYFLRNTLKKIPRVTTALIPFVTSLKKQRKSEGAYDMTSNVILIGIGARVGPQMK